MSVIVEILLDIKKELQDIRGIMESHDINHQLEVFSDHLVEAFDDTLSA